MRRVCHITTVHPHDDHRILHKECATLRDAGYAVTLVAPHEGDAELEGIRLVGLRGQTRNRLERTLRRPLAAYRAAVAQDAGLYHFHDPDFLPFAARLAARGRPVVYDAHEDVPEQIRNKDWLPAPAREGVARAFARLEEACAARCAAVVSPSASALERLRPRQPRVVALPNYPRLDAIAPGPWSGRERAACYVGGITRVRGVHELVAAMAHVDADLLLAGAFSPPALQAEVERAPGWARVRYLGRLGHEQIPDVLARARVGLIPLHPIGNYVEAYPVKLFEYMAAGLPVIATDVPLWRAVLETHGCGVCVPYGSPERLAEAIGALLDDEGRARAMGERGRAAAVAHYSWETQSAALLELYADLLP